MPQRAKTKDNIWNAKPTIVKLSIMYLLDLKI